MTLTVEQVLDCDLCGREIRRMKQKVRSGQHWALISGASAQIISGSPHDVCADCYAPLMYAFQQVKKEMEND